jgi:geranylgeranyl reductase family protein
MAKVHVVGAGPAGSIAAISAVRAGHNVILSEEHDKAGIPEHCSGLFSIEGLESLKSVISYKKFIINKLWGANIYFGKQKLMVRARKAIGCACDRSLMDEELASRAQMEGVKVKFNDKIKNEYQASNIIGADGPNSTIANNFNMGKIPKYASTLQAICKTKHKDPYAVEIYLSNEHFPGFFGWTIPHDEYTSEIGVGVQLPFNAMDAWKHLLKMKNMKDVPKPSGAIIPISLRETTAKRIEKKNVLLVGDAAGQVKSTTGGGVIFGGGCAKLAGKYADNPTRYEIEWRLRYGTDLMLHKMIRDFLDNQTDKKLEEFGKRLQKMRIDEYLSKDGNMDRPTSMIKPQMVLHIIKNFFGD